MIEAIGARHARRYFLTAERFDAAEAYRIGLVHDIVPLSRARCAGSTSCWARCWSPGPRAQARMQGADPHASRIGRSTRSVIAGTARHIADVRASAEGKEGVAAFLAKRAPAWVPPRGRATSRSATRGSDDKEAGK